MRSISKNAHEYVYVLYMPTYYACMPCSDRNTRVDKIEWGGSNMLPTAVHSVQYLTSWVEQGQDNRRQALLHCTLLPTCIGRVISVLFSFTIFSSLLLASLDWL